MSEKKINVAWISGAYYLAKPILDKIKEKVKDAEPFTCDSDTTFNKLFTMLSSNHCFNSNRFILVYGIPEMTDGEKKKFKSLIENITEDILLVFFMIDPSSEKAIFSSVEKVGKIYNFDTEVSISNAKDWIDKRSEEFSIEIEESAKIAIIENSGFNKDKCISVDILNMSLHKLIMHSPGKKIYDISDVILTSSFYESFLVWDLINACDDKDYEKCLNLFEKCVLTNNNTINALNEVINALVWKYRLLLFIKERIANKVDRQEIIKEASSIRKISYNGMGFDAKIRIDTVQTGENKGRPSCIWNSGIVSRAMTGIYGKKATIDLYTRKELYLIVNCLENCLIFTRSCEHDNEAYLISDIIFMTICSSVSYDIPKKLQIDLMKVRV